MDLNLLKTFTKVSEFGSLTKAAKIMGHPKSKVSRDLDKLESELEMKLLARTPRGISLTAQGEQLLNFIRPPLLELENSVEQMRSHCNEVKGNITITAPEDLSNLVLTRLSTEFMEMHPDLSIELIATNEYLDFNKHGVDLALRIGRLSDSNLIQRKIGDIEVNLFASSKYLRSNGRPETMADLNTHKLAAFKNPFGDRPPRSEFDKVDVNFKTNSINVLKTYITDNQGIATLPDFMCRKEIANKELQRVLPEFTYIRRTIYILSQQNSYMPKHVKIFKNFLFENIQKEILVI